MRGLSRWLACATGTVALVAGCAKIVGIEDYRPPGDGGGIDSPMADAFTPDAPFGSSVTFVKASNTGASDSFGRSIALSADGTTLVVGAYLEDSIATGIGGDEADDTAPSAGAVYVFVRERGAWMQQAYLKASNTDASDQFGGSIAVSADGNTLAIGAAGEDSSATGVGGNQADNTASSAGAVYVFSRTGATWTQQAYVKASNTAASDVFGNSVALSGDGDTLAVGATGEDSIATGVGGNQGDNTASSSGAVYVFRRVGLTWSQQAYVKSSNTATSDSFGVNVALADDGNTLAVGATGEDSSATGINGNQADNTATSSGALYVFARSGTAWTQQAYLKASNTETSDQLGGKLSMSGDGNLIAAGAAGEDSGETGVDGLEGDNSALSSGAVYVFARSGITWSQQSYVKASNTGQSDSFGNAVALARDGMSLAVGATGEDSNANGLEGDQLDNNASSAGAVYLFDRSATTWAQRAYVKAPHSDPSDVFGASVAVTHGVLVVGATGEDSPSTGLNGDLTDNGASSSGAAYVIE